MAYIDKDLLLKDISESVVFSVKGSGSPELRGARKIIDRIENAPTAYVEAVKHGEWIPVTDKLPKGRREYLCICVFGESELQYCNVLVFHPEKNAENGYVTGPHFSNEGMNGMRVTHWMPLPKPPCGAKMDGGNAE